MQAAAAAIEAAAADHAAARSRIESAAAALEEARLWLRKGEVLAPTDGLVSRTFLEQGENVEANKPLVTLVATARVKAVFALPERDAAIFAKGMPAAVTVASARPSRSRGGSPSSGSRRTLRRAPTGWKSTCRTRTGASRPGCSPSCGSCAVPSTAPWPRPVRRDARQRRHARFVYDNGAARRREVTAGILDGDRLQILGGLAPGDLLIVKGQRELEDGQRVALP